jgi:hypothetical protein
MFRGAFDAMIKRRFECKSAKRSVGRHAIRKSREIKARTRVWERKRREMDNGKMRKTQMKEEREGREESEAKEKL